MSDSEIPNVPTTGERFSEFLAAELSCYKKKLSGTKVEYDLISDSEHKHYRYYYIIRPVISA